MTWARNAARPPRPTSRIFATLSKGTLPRGLPISAGQLLPLGQPREDLVLHVVDSGDRRRQAHDLRARRLVENGCVGSNEGLLCSVELGGQLLLPVLLYAVDGALIAFSL